MGALSFFVHLCSHAKSGYQYHRPQSESAESCSSFEGRRGGQGRGTAMLWLDKSYPTLYMKTQLRES